MSRCCLQGDQSSSGTMKEEQHNVIRQNRPKKCLLSRSAPEHLMPGRTAEDDDVFLSRYQQISMERYPSAIKPPPAGKFSNPTKAINRIMRCRSEGTFASGRGSMQFTAHLKSEKGLCLNFPSSPSRHSKLGFDDFRSSALSAIWEFLTRNDVDIGEDCLGPRSLWISAADINDF